MSIKEEILATIEHVSKAAAKTSSNKNFGIYVSMISNLSSVLSVFANLENELSVKVKIYDSNDEKTVKEVERNKDIDWKYKKKPI